VKQAIANHCRLEEAIRRMRDLSQRVLLDSAPESENARAKSVQNPP